MRPDADTPRQERVSNPMTQTTDYGALLRDALTASTKTDNLIPLLVDGLLVITLGACSLGLALPPLMRGYTAMALRIARGETVAMGDSLKGFDHLGSSLVIGLLVVALAVVLSILPFIGTTAGLVLGTWVWCVHVDRPAMGAVDTLKASFDLVRAHLVETLVVWGVGLALGALLTVTVVGPVAALAYTTVVSALLYRRWSF